MYDPANQPHCFPVYTVLLSLVNTGMFSLVSAREEYKSALLSGLMIFLVKTLTCKTRRVARIVGISCAAADFIRRPQVLGRRNFRLVHL